MIIAVQGTNTFDDYNVFLRAMAVAMSGMAEDDVEVVLYSVGPAKINAMVSEFCNISERGMKARGMKIKHYKVSPALMYDNLDYVDYFAFLSQPNQPISKLAADVELRGIEIGIFRH